MTDAAGNSANDTFELTWDTVAPTVSLSTPADGDVNISVANGSMIIEFSEPVWDSGEPFNNMDITTVTWNANHDIVNVSYVNLTDLTMYYLDLVNLTMVDAAGNALTGAMNITFTTGDFTDPLADAGADQEVVEGTIVTFDGSASTDNGAIAYYNWTFMDETAQTLTGEEPTHNFTNVGVFVVTLNVTDEAGNWNLSTMAVTVVSDVDETDPIAEAGENQTVIQGTVVTFDGSGSSDNVGIDNYTWTFTDGTAQTLYGEEPYYNFTNAGNFTVTLVVKDEANNTASDTVVVNVEADTDGDGTPDATDTDDDNDGVNDEDDAFPLDPDETVDTDGDGTGNNADTDDDGDGTLDTSDDFPLDEDEDTDTDGDGTGDNADTDDDDDGVNDEDDAFPLDEDESVDTDDDGIGNNEDDDDDGDGILDEDDENPLDFDEDEGTPIWMWLVIILIIAGIGGVILMRGRGKKPEEPETVEAEEEAPIEEATVDEEISEIN